MNQLVVLPPASSPPSQRSLISHMALGAVVIFGLLGGLGFCAAAIDIAGAVVAPGVIVVTSDTKKVQHPSGGVVRDIRVHNGSSVKAGDLLLTLDDTVLTANLALVSNSLTELQVRKMRLMAERSGAAEMTLPPLDDLASEVVEHAMRDETALLTTRRAARESIKNQLHQRIAQIQNEVAGLEAQLDAKKQEIAFVGTELQGATQLWGKKLIAVTKYTALQREAARLDGERGQLMASIAQAQEKIGETSLKILQTDYDFTSEAGKDLRDTDYRIGELVERKAAAEDQLRRAKIISSQDGIVHELAVHSVGGVVSPGETIMVIVPQEEALISEVRIMPQDIDQVRVDQDVMLRFTAFDQGTTPACSGKVRYISPDLSSDRHTGATYYVARIELSGAQAACPGNLLPGMPVEAYLMTGQRSTLSYFTKPMRDQIARAFRER